MTATLTAREPIQTVRLVVKCKIISIQHIFNDRAGSDATSDFTTSESCKVFSARLTRTALTARPPGSRITHTHLTMRKFTRFGQDHCLEVRSGSDGIPPHFPPPSTPLAGDLVSPRPCRHRRGGRQAATIWSLPPTFSRPPSPEPPTSRTSSSCSTCLASSLPTRRPAPPALPGRATAGAGRPAQSLMPCSPSTWPWTAQRTGLTIPGTQPPPPGRHGAEVQMPPSSPPGPDRVLPTRPAGRGPGGGLGRRGSLRTRGLPMAHTQM